MLYLYMVVSVFQENATFFLRVMALCLIEGGRGERGSQCDFLHI
ncbi:hypothetical protein HMPREF3185_00650 [Porphyromonas somerae]|uniref:Uncharacterized protein n=1 Tax=Porphyromonas somerae TaxID=322095 RepID=A0A134BAQ1_9PORP|nr:hypothetical protein HMPREF3184_00650 [Porphyromonadaceae bacterium KA00676]KXB76995.1 hypothetical protein HMPREF3185_00650 [Porphyromonas somerae]